MKNHYRLLVLDVDGTLVDGNGALSPEDEAALAQARQAGVQVVLSTGRAVQACQRFLDRLTVAEALRLLAAGAFPPGSMGPKVEAAVEFIERGGRRAVITSLDRIAEAVAGRAGTAIE